MTDPRLFRLRVTYIEHDRLAMLSHLEVAHALERVVRRAKLPFAVSQGFSPHMKIAFGSALPVGVGSTCEIFDVQLTSYVAPAKALAALQAASPAALMVQECHYIEHNAKAASVAYPLSTYEVRFSRELAEGEFVVPSQIVRVRKKKGKVRETVFDVAEYLQNVPRIEGDTVTFALLAKPEGSLRPDLFVSECLAAVPQAPRVVSITRIAQM